MKTSDFDYHLPEELIAQTPILDRSASRLMIVDRESGELSHKHFYDLEQVLCPGDVLVLNDTKVLPARLLGIKQGTLAAIEILLLRQLEGDVWETLVKPARRVNVGTIVHFGDGELSAECVFVGDEGIRHFRFRYEGIFLEVLDHLGEMPLPPYIHEKLIDRDRYQTVYSRVVGSAAAPTAGLHFTNDLIECLKSKGIIVCYLTLHVGLGTFRPVQVDDVATHKMHSEFFVLPAETAAILAMAKTEHRPIIAVGTTSTRTLETVMARHGKYVETSGWTDIFLYPGHQFRGIDGLITNFHLPKSTLIMLVSAFSSQDIVMHAYETAVAMRYRFFSFGDAMYFPPKR